MTFGTTTFPCIPGAPNSVKSPTYPHLAEVVATGCSDRLKELEKFRYDRSYEDEMVMPGYGPFGVVSRPYILSNEI